MRAAQEEFQEIGHCGGKVTFNVVTGADGRRSYQVSWQSSRPVPAAIFAIYALREGIPVAPLDMGGIGQPWKSPPFPGCFPVFIASDSQGKFGFQCPECQGYWRARGGAAICPYCGLHAQRHDFLSAAQRRYVGQYCEALNQALEQDEDGNHTIDMDVVADAVGKDTEKPPFYYAEQSQQNNYLCNACGEFNDIIGRFGYCSACGTRNDLTEFSDKTIPGIRARANEGGALDACLKDAASAFDSFIAQYVKQIVLHIPMRQARKNRLTKMRFHNLAVTREDVKTSCDIDICEGLSTSEIDAAQVMFYRRHVYEHNGGEVDEKYLAESGDASVRLKQSLRETQPSVHQFLGTISKMAANLHRGFHDIFPPEQGAINYYLKKQQTMREYEKKKR